MTILVYSILLVLDLIAKIIAQLLVTVIYFFSGDMNTEAFSRVITVFLMIVTLLIFIFSIGLLLFLFVIDLEKMRRNLLLNSSLDKFLIETGFYEKLNLFLKPKMLKLTLIVFDHQQIEFPFVNTDSVTIYDLIEKFTETFKVNSVSDLIDVLIHCSDASIKCTERQSLQRPPFFTSLNNAFDLIYNIWVTYSEIQSEDITKHLSGYAIIFGN